MSIAIDIIEMIKANRFDAVFEDLYGKESIAAQKERYIGAILAFCAKFGEDRDIGIYSVPGRTELCGNHTDHNNGLVMAASVNLDSLAVAAKNDSNVIHILSKGFPEDIIADLANLSPDKEEFGKSSAIARGVAVGIINHGGDSGGFDAYITSDVLQGSGLSSSASFEVCIGVIINHTYNGGRFSSIELGRIGQYSENVYFGKPSGLQDQLACAVGGVITINLADPSKPEVANMEFDLEKFGLKLIITDTRGSHADLTEEYAAIRAEMESVAAVFGKKVMNEVDPEEFFLRAAEVREKTCDRAVLRALHFFGENLRVPKLAEAIRDERIEDILGLIVESGHSSFEYNQNAYPRSAINQEIPVALAISQSILAGRGAWRLQGGGFAGTIQAFVPFDLVTGYCEILNRVFGEGACNVLTVRRAGCIKVPIGTEYI
jgi:galactokinase